MKRRLKSIRIEYYIYRNKQGYSLNLNMINPMELVKLYEKAQQAKSHKKAKKCLKKYDKLMQEYLAD